MNLEPRHFLYAGAKRARTMRDLIGHLASFDRHDPALPAELAALPKIAGGAQQTIVVTTSPAALGGAQATYIGPLLGIIQLPLILGWHYLPQIAGTTATATVTLQMRRTDTPAVISNAVHLCGTADTNPGPFTILGIVPFGIPAANGIDVQGAASAGAGTPTASATAPILLGYFALS